MYLNPHIRPLAGMFPTYERILKMNILHRFWFTFVDAPNYSPLTKGCGITAFDYDDAISILRHRVYPKVGTLLVGSVKEDIDIQVLDRNHVIPNMGQQTSADTLDKWELLSLPRRISVREAKEHGNAFR